jgi:hypothetical protein
MTYKCVTLIDEVKNCSNNNRDIKRLAWDAVGYCAREPPDEAAVRAAASVPALNHQNSASSLPSPLRGRRLWAWNHPKGEVGLPPNRWHYTLPIGIGCSSGSLLSLVFMDGAQEMKIVLKFIAGFAAILFAFWGISSISDALTVPYTTWLTGVDGLGFLLGALLIYWFGFVVN